MLPAAGSRAALTNRASFVSSWRCNWFASGRNIDAALGGESHIETSLRYPLLGERFDLPAIDKPRPCPFPTGHRLGHRIIPKKPKASPFDCEANQLGAGCDKPITIFPPAPFRAQRNSRGVFSHPMRHDRREKPKPRVRDGRNIIGAEEARPHLQTQQDYSYDLANVCLREVITKEKIISPSGPVNPPRSVSFCFRC